MIKITTLIKKTKKGDVEINVPTSEVDSYLLDNRFRLKETTAKSKGKDKD